MIHIFGVRATKEQLAQMLRVHGAYVKLAVDIRRKVIAGGGALHSDCEAVLLRDGSLQEDIWGVDWLPSTEEVLHRALINIRPRQSNPSMTILDPTVRGQVEQLVKRLLEAV